MDAVTLRRTFLEFFREHGHAIIGSAPLIPENDPSALFTVAGMHPLVPYLLGQPHPAGRRLANVQKCLRTVDIDEVGDDVHLTFFEMLGNWSLGDYGKEGAIRLSYAFLTERLGLEPDRLAVTCFAGDDAVPRDEETARIWRSLGLPPERITFLPRSDNWWGPVGSTGPCGPDTEMFYDTRPDGPRDQDPASHPDRFWELWNDVFLEYDRQEDGTYAPLQHMNVDTGMGLERTIAVLQGVSSPYETELFLPLMGRLRARARDPQPYAMRVIADHVRAATFILAEGILPGNVDQPYVARRLIRRAVRYGQEIGLPPGSLAGLAEAVIPTLADAYPELVERRPHILTALEGEEEAFLRTLERGRREFERLAAARDREGDGEIGGREAFRLYDTYGFPIELTRELAAQRGLRVDVDGYREAFLQHQEASRRGAAGRFRGGLAERRPETVRLHTATHLLHEALRRVLGAHVEQRGSNITVERLRFDFSHGARLTDGEIAEVVALVNAQIARDLPVTWEEMSVEEAERSGAIGLFAERYGETVRVYTIGDFSKEVCGGPHVERTGELGRFRIVKEESVGAGARRIRAVLE